MAAHQAPPSLGFSRQEHWSGLPFHSPMHESEKWKWSRSVVSDPRRPHGLRPTGLLRSWDFQARVLEWGAIAFSGIHAREYYTCVLSHAQVICKPMDCSLPGSTGHGIFLARILEWVAFSSSRGSSRPRGWNPCLLHYRQILYHWATWKAHRIPCSLLKEKRLK